MKVNQELYDYLLHEWKFNNHVKYLKYFSEWIENLTEKQINWYEIYKQGKKTLC